MIRHRGWTVDSEVEPMGERERSRHDDRSEIARLKSRYCRFVDTKQWSRLAGLFTSDATFEGFGSVPAGADVEAFVAGVSARLTPCVSVHHCHMPDIVFSGLDEARAIWAMTDHLEWPSDVSPREAPDAAGFIGFGYYEDAYRRDGEGWRISFSRLVRLRIDPLPKQATLPVRILLAARLGDAAREHDWLTGFAVK